MTLAPLKLPARVTKKWAPKVQVDGQKREGRRREVRGKKEEGMRKVREKQGGSKRAVIGK